jgi:hypothetical protein
MKSRLKPVLLGLESRLKPALLGLELAVAGAELFCDFNAGRNVLDLDAGLGQ